MQNRPSPWLPAAFTTAVVAVLEAAVVWRLIPRTTVVAVAALLVTGFLAGLFTGFHLRARRAEKTAAPG